MPNLSDANPFSPVTTLITKGFCLDKTGIDGTPISDKLASSAMHAHTAGFSLSTFQAAFEPDLACAIDYLALGRAAMRRALGAHETVELSIKGGQLVPERSADDHAWHIAMLATGISFDPAIQPRAEATFVLRNFLIGIAKRALLNAPARFALDDLMVGDMQPLLTHGGLSRLRVPDGHLETYYHLDVVARGCPQDGPALWYVARGALDASAESTRRARQAGVQPYWAIGSNFDDAATGLTAKGHDLVTVIPPLEAKISQEPQAQPHEIKGGDPAPGADALNTPSPEPSIAGVAARDSDRAATSVKRRTSKLVLGDGASIETLVKGFETSRFHPTKAPHLTPAVMRIWLHAIGLTPLNTIADLRKTLADLDSASDLTEAAVSLSEIYGLTNNAGRIFNSPSADPADCLRMAEERRALGKWKRLSDRQRADRLRRWTAWLEYLMSSDVVDPPLFQTVREKGSVQ